MRMACHVLISGRVQGVWYRGWTVENALAHGLTGWVRNRPDGTVEAIFAGPSDRVDDMIAACHVGPPAARVDAVASTVIADEGWSGFTQRPTGDT